MTKKEIMNDRIIKLLKEIASNEGKVINNLIKANVFTTDYIVNAAIEYNDNRIMYFVAKYVESIDIENINRLAEKVKVADLGFRRNYDVIYWFAKEVKNAPIDKLAEGIMNTRNVGYMKILQTHLSDKKEYIISQEKIDSTERLLKEEKEMLDRLINLANLDEVEKIHNDAALYRKLFIDENIENSQNSVKTRRLVLENNGEK